jgi:CO dehydrogenase/acetyl-CoA synthase beta subunit
MIMDLAQDQTTVARLAQARIINMNNPNHENLRYLTGFLHYLNRNHIYLRSRRNGMVTNFLKLCLHKTDGLKWMFLEGRFPFDPKTIIKIKDRKVRKNCYRCFAKYKKPIRSEKSLNVWGEVNRFLQQNKEEIMAFQY